MTDVGGTGMGSDAVTTCEEQEDDYHLRNLPDGIGCTEIWEHLSEARTEDEE